MTLICGKSLTAFSVRFIFSSMQIADAMASEILIRPVDRRVTQNVATQYACSKQYHLKQFSLKRVQNFTQAPSELEYSKPIASVFFFVLMKKKLNSFAALQPFKKFACFALKMHRKNFEDMIYWIGIITLCFYQRNWTPKKVQVLTESLLLRIPPKQTNIVLTALPLILIDRLLKFKLKRSKRNPLYPN